MRRGRCFHKLETLDFNGKPVYISDMERIVQVEKTVAPTVALFRKTVGHMEEGLAHLVVEHPAKFVG